MANPVQPGHVATVEHPGSMRIALRWVADSQKLYLYASKLDGDVINTYDMTRQNNVFLDMTGRIGLFTAQQLAREVMQDAFNAGRPEKSAKGKLPLMNPDKKQLNAIESYFRLVDWIYYEVRVMSRSARNKHQPANNQPPPPTEPPDPDHVPLWRR